MTFENRGNSNCRMSNNNQCCNRRNQCTVYIPGPRGPRGIPGPRGPVGPTGCQGLRGRTGATGPQGIQGVTGNTAPFIYAQTVA